MARELHKILYKFIPFVLCICIVSGAAAPAYATAGPYDQGIYNNTLNIMQYSSSSNTFLSNIYTLLSQFKTNFDSFSASWNTTTFLPNSLLNNINSTITTLNNNFVNNTHDYSSTLTDIYNTLVLARSDLYTIDSNVDNIYTWVMSIGQALAGIQTDVSSIASDTSNLPGIKTDTSSINTSLSFRSNFGTTLPDFTSIRTGIGVLGTRKSYLDPVISWRSDNGAIYNFDSYNVSYITDYLRLINFNIANLGAMAFSPKTYYGSNRYVTFDGTTGSSVALYSLGDMISLLNTNITNSLSRLGYVLADDNTINAKAANASQEQTVLSNFTGSGAASASVSDFGAVKDSMVSFKSGFSGGASSSDTFGFLSGDSNAWDWFTQDTANDLDRTQGNNTRLLRSSSDVAYDTPLLDSYYNSILSILGGDD